MRESDNQMLKGEREVKVTEGVLWRSASFQVQPQLSWHVCVCVCVCVCVRVCHPAGETWLRRWEIKTGVVENSPETRQREQR